LRKLAVYEDDRIFPVTPVIINNNNNNNEDFIARPSEKLSHSLRATLANTPNWIQREASQQNKIRLYFYD